MAAAARASTPLAAVMDAARPALTSGFDLVCSSLTLQWMADPAAALAAWRVLVRPGGRLAVATLTGGSFAEWPPARRFPSADEARAWFGLAAAFETLTLTERHPSALAFLRALKASGTDAADTPARDAGTMRRAMRAFEAGGGVVTYEVLMVVERA